MVFQNEKKTFLAKLDQSKKGGIDEKVVSLLEVINQKDNYYTTSSCSGRVYLWSGSGKKNETEWLNVSHDLISKDFFGVEAKDLVWLRLEGFILHVACEDIEAANHLLTLAKTLYKKSNILSISNKIIVEIRGSELLEMPFYENNNLVFSGDLDWLTSFVNQKLESVWEKVENLKTKLK